MTLFALMTLIYAISAQDCNITMCGSTIESGYNDYNIDLSSLLINIDQQRFIGISTCSINTTFDTYLYLYNEETTKIIDSCDDHCNTDKSPIPPCMKNGKYSPETIWNLDLYNLNATRYILRVNGYENQTGQYKLTLSYNCDYKMSLIMSHTTTTTTSMRRLTITDEPTLPSSNTTNRNIHGYWQNPLDQHILLDVVFDATNAIVAYWDSKLFVIGTEAIYFRDFQMLKLLDHAVDGWNYKLHPTIDLRSAKYHQYESNIYIWWSNVSVTNKTWQQLTIIDLVELEINTWWLNDIDSKEIKHCIFGKAMSIIYLFSNVSVYRYKCAASNSLGCSQTDHDTWNVSVISNAPTACVSIQDEWVYILGIVEGSNKSAIVKYDMGHYDHNVPVVQVPNVCGSFERVTAISGENNMIYLHGCSYAAGWETLMFNLTNDLFTQETTNINTAAVQKSVELYDGKKLIAYEDNLLLLIPNISLSLNTYQPIYITPTQSLSIYLILPDESIWPSESNEFVIQYYLYNFITSVDNIYNISLHIEHVYGDIKTFRSIQLDTKNDHCICDQIRYKCFDCRYTFNFKSFLSSNNNTLRNWKVSPIVEESIYDFETLISPKKFYIRLKRCRVTFNVLYHNESSITLGFDLLSSRWSDCFSTRSTSVYSANINISTPSSHMMQLLDINVYGCNTAECAVYSQKTYWYKKIYHENECVIPQTISSVHDTKIEMSSTTIDMIVESPYVLYLRKPIANISPYYWFLLLIIPMSIICIICIYCRKLYINDVFAVNNALVMLIGISEFDDKKSYLPGVEKCISDLIKLWRNEYNYDVFVCNGNSLYSTKSEVIYFVDKHVAKLSAKYDCVIVHILSHATSKQAFQTSNAKNIAVDFIIHELATKAEEIDHWQLLKLIFHHGCQGNANYNISPKNVSQSRGLLNMYPSISNIKYNKDNVSCDSNIACIAGNVSGRSMSDSGNFTKCIYNSFSKNLTRKFKWSWDALIKEIHRNLETITNNAELVTMETNICYNTIRFEKCNMDEKKQSCGPEEIDKYHKFVCLTVSILFTCCSCMIVIAALMWFVIGQYGIF
eukprot:115871_1